MDSDQLQSPKLDFFNIFNENLLYDENTHSNIISYFLGENKNGHRFPQYETVLKKLLLDHFKIRDDLTNQMKFEDVKVTREFAIFQNQKRGRIDILVTIPVKDDAKLFALVIENKILSFEQSEQLHRYGEHAKNTYHPASLLVLLSPKQIDTPHPEYKPLSYKGLEQVLQNIHSEDKYVQAFITLYSLCLNQVSEHVPSKFQDHLATAIKTFISEEQYSAYISNIGSYSNTWIDFEPDGWDELIKKQWKNPSPIPKDGIWGFSFWLSQRNGLSLDFYFLDDAQLQPFYERVLERGHQKGITGFRTPKIIGEGKNIWVSIYRHEILTPQQLSELEESSSKQIDIKRLADIAVETTITNFWKACIDDLDQIYELLEKAAS